MKTHEAPNKPIHKIPVPVFTCDAVPACLKYCPRFFLFLRSWWVTYVLDRTLSTTGAQVHVNVDGPYGFPLEVRKSTGLEGSGREKRAGRGERVLNVTGPLSFC